MQITSEKTDQLFKALFAAQAELKHAEKSSNNPHFKSKYADLPTVLDTAKPVLKEYGLGVNHVRGQDAAGREILVTTLFHADSGQWMRSYALLNPTKNDPQGMGSAITYNRRYDLQSILGMAADDDDGNAASQATSQKQQASSLTDAMVKAQEEKLAAYNQAKAGYVIEPHILPTGQYDFDGFAAVLEEQVQGAPSLNDLSMLKKANAKVLNAMKAERPDLFDYIKDLFTKHSNVYA